MQEIVINIIILSVYALVACKKYNTTSFPYSKIITAILLPAVLILAIHFSFAFLPDSTFIAAWDVISYLIICLANLIACCHIYKIMTVSNKKLILIWQNDLKKWNILSLFMVAIGTFTAAAAMKYATTAIEFETVKLFNDSILSFLSFADTTLVLLRCISVAKYILRAASVVFLIIPLFSSKNKSITM